MKFCGSSHRAILLVTLLAWTSVYIQVDAQIVFGNNPILGDPVVSGSDVGDGDRQVVSGDAPIVGDPGFEDLQRSIVVAAPPNLPDVPVVPDNLEQTLQNVVEQNPPPAPAPAPVENPPPAPAPAANPTESDATSAAATTTSSASSTGTSSATAMPTPNANQQKGTRMAKETVFNNIVQGAASDAQVESSSLSAGAVFGIVVGGVVGLAVVFMFVKRVVGGSDEPTTRPNPNLEAATSAFSGAAGTFGGAVAAKKKNESTAPLQAVQISDPMGEARRGSIGLALYANGPPNRNTQYQQQPPMPSMPVASVSNPRMRSLAMEDPQHPFAGVGRPMVMSPSIVAIGKLQNRQDVQKRQQQQPPAQPVNASANPLPLRQPVVMNKPPVQKSLIPDRPQNEYNYSRTVDPILDGPTYKQANRVSMRRLSLSSEVGSLVTSVSRNPPNEQGRPMPTRQAPQFLKASTSTPQLHSPRAERPVSRVVVTKAQVTPSHRVVSKPTTGPLSLVDKLEKASSTPDLPNQLHAYETSKLPLAPEPYRGERHSEESSVYGGRRVEDVDYHQRRSEDLKPIRNKGYPLYDHETTSHYPMTAKPKPMNSAAFASFTARPTVLTSAMQEAKAAMMQPAYTNDSSSLADMSPPTFNRNLYAESTAAPPSSLGMHHIASSSSSLPSTVATDRHHHETSNIAISSEMRELLGQYLLGDGTDLISNTGNESIAGATSAMSDIEGSVVAQRPTPPPMPPMPHGRLGHLQEDSESVMSSEADLLGAGLLQGKRQIVDSVSAMSEDDASSRY